MNVTISGETPAKRPSVYWALDARLPRTATHAAIEFDWLLQKKHGRSNPTKPLRAIRALCELIKEPVQDLPARESRSLTGSVGLELLTEAYNESNSAHRIETSEDLNNAMAELTDTLDKACHEQELDEGALKKMQNFCIALARSAMTYRDTVYVNSRPYRR